MFFKEVKEKDGWQREAGVGMPEYVVRAKLILDLHIF